MNPARIVFGESDRRPGIREQPGSNSDLGARLLLADEVSRAASALPETLRCVAVGCPRKGGQ